MPEPEGAHESIVEPGHAPVCDSSRTEPIGGDWTALVDGPLPVAEASAWVVRPDCGAVVTFTGTARNCSEGRPGVDRLTYEAYTEQVGPALDRVAADLRSRWPNVGRVVLLHRVGDVAIGQEAVVVAVSAPHRDEAFQAARFAIDAVKETVPIWKRERWQDGDDWGLGARPLAGAVVAGRSGRGDAT